jgi:hypothetical protein
LQKYLTADWDGCAANKYFANKFNPNISGKYFGKPKNDFFNSLLEIDFAEKGYTNFKNTITNNHG